MANKEQLRRLHRIMHKLRCKAFDTEDAVSTAKGPSTVEIARLTPDEVRQWRETARALLDLDPNWQSAVVTGSSMMPGGEVSTLVMCECCLTASTVTLAKPLLDAGLISRHQDGDWICGKCDPRVGTWIEIYQLSKLVNKKSS